MPTMPVLDSTGATQTVAKVTATGQTTGANSLPVVIASDYGGSVGSDASANKPALPNIGANFSNAGPYANYVLIATVAAATRNNVEIDNLSGSQIAVIRDDGTASGGSAPVNASVFALSPGSSPGAQGGSWSSRTFWGRLQIYALSSTAQVNVMVD